MQQKTTAGKRLPWFFSVDKSQFLKYDLYNKSYF